MQSNHRVVYLGEPGRVGSTDTGSDQFRERTAIMAARKSKRLMRSRHWTLTECLELYSIPEPNSGCRLWIRHASKEGYGILKWDGRAQKAHRLAWMCSHGPVPPGMLVCHKCDVPSCVNPAHLFLGKDADNSADKIAKGRQAHVRGTQQPRAKLTEGDVTAIREDHRILREIAADYGVSVGLIFFVKKRVAWPHVL